MIAKIEIFAKLLAGMLHLFLKTRRLAFALVQFSSIKLTYPNFRAELPVARLGIGWFDPGVVRD